MGPPGLEPGTMDYESGSNQLSYRPDDGILTQAKVSLGPRILPHLRGEILLLRSE